MTTPVTIFRKKRLPPEKLARLNNAVDKLREVTGQPFSLIKVFFGRYIIAENDRILAAVVGTLARPSRTTVVAVDSLGNHLLPIQSQSAANRCCELLGVDKTQEKTALLKLFNSEHAGMR